MQQKEARKVFNRIFGKATILPSAKRWGVPDHEIGKTGRIIYDDGKWIGVRTKYLDKVFWKEYEQDRSWRMLREDIE